MPKKEVQFNEIVRRVRQDHFGKGPERIRTLFVENMAITTLHGNLTSTEKFISRTPEGAEMIHSARTTMIQQLYKNEVPAGMEELVGAKLVHLFSDFKVNEDMAISIFVFDQRIDQDLPE
jgi:uncharacterized protein YbcI